MGWEWRQGKTLSYLTIPQWEEQGIEVGFSSRAGGMSRVPFSSLNLGFHVGDEPDDVLANRSLWKSEWDAGWADFTLGEQVHGHQVIWCDHSAGGRGSQNLTEVLPGVDGLLTDTDLGLMALYADCVPLFFYDFQLNAVAIAHAGWRGTGQKIAKVILDAFRQKGGSAEKTWVGIGPAIGSCCYQVDEGVARLLENSLGHGPWMMDDEGDPGHFKINLVSANREILLQEGVNDRLIWQADLCTACHADHFFSYRRDGKTGRMAGWIKNNRGGTISGQHFSGG